MRNRRLHGLEFNLHNVIEKYNRAEAQNNARQSGLFIFCPDPPARHILHATIARENLVIV